jgi:hypothetical protein
MIFDCIHRYFFYEPTKQERENYMSGINEMHQTWLTNAQAEAKKRFLKLEPTDAGHTHWRLLNSSGELVYPTNRFGYTKAEINGFFLQNPQA